MPNERVTVTQGSMTPLPTHPVVTFPLPSGNMVELRTRWCLTEEEWGLFQRMLALLKPSLVLEK